METNQFAEFASAVVRQLPRNVNLAKAQRLIREQGVLAKILRKAFEVMSYELYLAPGQQNGRWMKGSDLEKHLLETKLIERALSLDDELVKGWFADPSSYPEEFKGKEIFLWKSTRTSGSSRFVAYLYWSGGRVVVDWSWLESGWDGYDPALLASA